MLGFALAVLAAAAAGVPAGGGVERLPDLDQATPGAPYVTRAGGRYRLAFASAVENVGAGPLIVRGERLRRGAAMRADQAVRLAGGGVRLYRSVGWIRFVRSPDHRHWHLLDFDRYELRRADDRDVVVRDRKTGFCLGDRYVAAGRAPAPPRWTARCGLNDPTLRRLEQGITVGYGDDYKPDLEGQYLDVTGLPPGRYVLVHRANPDRRLRESDYGNNEASLLLRLAWPDGANASPRVAVLAACPDDAQCGS